MNVFVAVALSNFLTWWLTYKSGRWERDNALKVGYDDGFDAGFEAGKGGRWVKR